MNLSSNRMWLGTELFNGSFGNKYTSNDVQTHIDYCVDLGLDKIDTAECYGVEKMLGDALIGKRNKFFVGTKFGHDNEKKPNSESYTLTLPSVKKQLNESLKNLRTDYIGWCNTAQNLTNNLSLDQKQNIFYDNAIKFYKLKI